MPIKIKSLLSAALALIVLTNNSCSNFIPDLGVCENTSQKEVFSPNGKLKTVIFDRGCGATVGFITGISVILVNETISNKDTGNILFAENVYQEISSNNIGKINFGVKWINDEELLVLYSESKSIKKRESFQNVKINYELISK